MTDLQERGKSQQLPPTPDVPDAAVRCLLSFLEEGAGGLGFEPRAARRWLDESLLLAAHEPGRRAADLTDAPLLAAVYRDLESIERSCRAELLRGLARVLARRAPGSVGSAALDLIAPLSSGAADALRAGFRREAARNVSVRLFDGAAPQHGLFSALECGAAHGETMDVVRAFADLAALLAGGSSGALEGGFEGRLASAEARLAHEGGGAVASDLVALTRTLDEASDPAPSQGAVAQDAVAQDAGAQDAGAQDAGAQDIVARDVVERLRTAAAFAAGDDATVLEALVGGALSLDRSAAAGTMRAVSTHRQRGGRPAATDRCAPARDEFSGTLDADERKRIARFLAAATSVSHQEEVETT